MSDPKTCPTCGAPLPSDATGGACPKCLLEAGFATGGSSPPAGDHVPTPDELAPKFPGLVIEELLGRGGMGVVYKARHKALDREVALKVLPERVASDRAFADRFQREARALAKLQHPNIVAVHDFGQTDGLFWLVMEYVDGANIRQAMRAGQIGPKEALAIVPQICDALQYAHEHGVVHRDIKPENVLLDKAGRVKVADFGLAKLMERDAADLTLTGAGQVMGTPHYMAPEQWEKPTTVDHRADIYSLGVVFYEMLTGELPVGQFAAPSGKCDVDTRIDEIVMRTLEREREARYQQVSQVKTDMGVAAASARDASVAAPVDVPPWAHHWKWPVRVSTLAGILSLLWGLFSTEAAAERLWIGGFGFVVCVVQFVDWRIRRAHPEDADTHRRMAWLVGSSVVSVGMCVILANTLHTQVMRNAAGTLAFVVGAFLLVEMWRLRHAPRPGATKKPLSAGAWVAIAVLGFVFLGGLATCALMLTGKPAQDRLDALKLVNEQKQREQEAAIWPTSGDDFSEIGNKWKRLVVFGPGARFDDLVSLYDRANRSDLTALTESDRLDKARTGALGLPLLPANRLPRPLQEFHFEGVKFEDGASPPLRAVATVAAETAKIRFPMSRSFEDGDPRRKLSKWDFAVGQVEVESDPDVASGQFGSARDFTAVDDRGEVASITADDRERIADLWLRVQRLPATVSPETAGDLYSLPDRLRMADWLREGRMGDAGLPLLLSDRIPASLAKYRIERVEFERGAGAKPMSARAVATNGAFDVWFWFRRGFVGDAAQGVVGEWFFDTAPVVVAKRSNVPASAALSHEAARLLDALRQIKTPRTLKTTKDLYWTGITWSDALLEATPSEPYWSAVSDGSHGLPLTSDAALGGRLADFRIDDVAPSQDGKHAGVTLRNRATHQLVVFRIVLDDDGVWRFATTAVERR